MKAKFKRHLVAKNHLKDYHGNEEEEIIIIIIL